MQVGGLSVLDVGPMIGALTHHIKEGVQVVRYRFLDGCCPGWTVGELGECVEGVMPGLGGQEALTPLLQEGSWSRSGECAVAGSVQ